MRRLGGQGTRVDAGGPGPGDVIEVTTLDGAAVVEVVADAEPGLVEVTEPVLVGADVLGVALDDLVDVDASRDLPPGRPLLLTRDVAGVYVLREQEETGGRAHTHVQAVPSTIWPIMHELPFLPAGLVVTSPDGSRRLYPQRVSYPAPGRVRLDFTRPVPGIAYLS